jgi:hypothetical protein
MEVRSKFQKTQYNEKLSSCLRNDKAKVETILSVFGVDVGVESQQYRGGVDVSMLSTVV